MKSNPFVDYILYDVFGERENMSARAMMGGYIIYTREKVIALAEDDQLYLKGDKNSGEWFLSQGSKKFSYLKKDKSGKRKLQEMNFFLVPEDVLENREKFQNWVDVASASSTH